MNGVNEDAQFMAPVELVPNPTFCFPAAPPTTQPAHKPRRTASLHLNPSTPPRVTSLERRSASTLPCFTFNATDTSGRSEDPTLSLTVPDLPSSANRGLGHRRGASELVGGSPKYGTPPTLITSSPVKTTTDSRALALDAPSLGSPLRKRGHAHRRSAAMSTHEVQTILQPRDVNFDASSADDSNAPSESPSPNGSAKSLDTANNIPDRVAQPRARVGFANRLEFIPRPLSTISSEAESISSNHAVSSSNATNSPHRPMSFSPTNRRKSPSSRSSLSEVESVGASPSSMGQPPPLQTEGFPLRSDPDRPVTEPLAPAATKSASSHRDFTFPPRKPKGILDRRSSEPSLSVGSLAKPRRSSISLRDTPQTPKSKRSEGDIRLGKMLRKSSASKVRAWATAMIGRKKSQKRPAIDFAPADAQPPPATPTSLMTDTPVSEPDLEELFSRDPFSLPEDEDTRLTSFAPQMDWSSMRDAQTTSVAADSSGTVIDLDAALGPNKTPGRSPGFGARRQLHSSRANRDFNSPSNIFHRRAESAPVLAPFDYAKSPSPAHSPMQDVFEEEEDEIIDSARSDVRKAPDFAFPTAAQGGLTVPDDGLGIRDPNSPISTPTTTTFHTDLPVMQDTIMEEVGPIDIVESYEEPRASTMTKSSDSSETPTVLADPSLPTLAPPQMPYVTTPSTFASSVCSTPDFAVRQVSFEAQRLGTSASSATDCRTISSYASERPDTRPSVDDVPSLTSSRSTMVSSGPTVRRDDRVAALRNRQISADQQSERRRKRASIQSLGKLMSSSFGENRNRLTLREHGNASTPNLLLTTSELGDGTTTGRKREHRLSKLMFWKHKGSSRLSTASGI